MKKIISLSLLTFMLVSCGGAGANNQSSSAKQSTQIRKKRLINTNFSLANNLHSTQSYVEKTNTKSTYYDNLSFKKDYNQGLDAKGVVIAVIDSGMKNALINQSYSYKDKNNNIFHSLSYRLNDNNFTQSAYKNSVLYDTKEKKYLNHGELVASTASLLAPNVSFANILADGLQNTSGNANMMPSIDALSNKGVRFFNQSFAPNAYIDKTEVNTGMYIPSVIYQNALVVSAAGNIYDNSPIAAHALPLNSDLRKGWIIALGYEKSFLNKTTNYWVIDNGKKIYLNPKGNSCKQSYADCLSAPFTINNNSGTSFSTPAILSTAALLYKKYPWLSNENIKDILFSTAYKVYSSDAKEKEYFGQGVLNAAKALNGPANLTKSFVANVDTNTFSDFSNSINSSSNLVKNGEGTLILSAQNSFNQKSYINQGVLWLKNKNNASFENNSILRASNASVKDLYNNNILINENLSLDNLYLGENSHIYANLGNILNIKNTAKLDGNYSLVGLAYKYVPKGSNYDETILNAGNIQGKFKKIDSIQSAFLKINKVSYLKNKILLNISLKNTEQLASIDELARRNYESIFKSVNEFFAYENSKAQEIPNEAKYNNKDYLLGMQDANKAVVLANDIVNTNNDDLKAFSNNLFAKSFAGNYYLNLARINFLFNDNVNTYGFNVKQSFQYANLNSYKENSSTLSISYKDSYYFDYFAKFMLNYADIENKNYNFTNKAISLGFILGFDFNNDLFNLESKIAYFNVNNEVNRLVKLDNLYSEFSNNFLALNLKPYLTYEFNFILFKPFLSLNYIYSFNNSFSEDNNSLYALNVNKFNYNHFSTQLGLENEFKIDDFYFNLNFALSRDFSPKKILSANFVNLESASILIKERRSPKTKFKSDLNINYKISDNSSINTLFNTELSKRYSIYSIMLGLNYKF